MAVGNVTAPAAVTESVQPGSGSFQDPITMAGLRMEILMLPLYLARCCSAKFLVSV